MNKLKISKIIFPIAIPIGLYYNKKINSTQKLNIVFDMDETLIKTVKKINVDQKKITNEYFEYDNNTITVIRPFSLVAVKLISKFNNIYLFTKGKKEYALRIVNELKNHDVEFKKCIYREDQTIVCNNKNCDKTYSHEINYNNGLYCNKCKNKITTTSLTKKIDETTFYLCKDLNLIDDNINMNKTILIDDIIDNQCPNQNLYYIPEYDINKKNDYEMIKLCFYIIWINIKYDIFGKI